MRFQPGQSGNPSGRPRGALNRATVLAQGLLYARVEGIAGKLIELAEGGDMRAIRVCMERLMPVIKHQPIAVELPPIENAADSVEAVSSIAAAVAAGGLLTMLTNSRHSSLPDWSQDDQALLTHS